MDLNEYQRMYDSEQRSWWFCARRHILDAVVGRLNLPADALIADLGCGTGGNLVMLGQHGSAQGVEPSPTAAEFARTRTGLEVKNAAAADTMLAPEAFQLVTMFDVLEHLDDEKPALREVRRILAPEGGFLFTVPAFMFLWSGHDEALHHRRRYRRPELLSLLTENEFEVKWLSYYNSLLFPAVALIRLLRRMVGGGRRQADVGELAGGTNALLEAIFSAERHVIGRTHLPFGVSLIGYAQLPQQLPD